MNVSVNLWQASLRQLQIISQVQGRGGKVERLIQHAIDEYLETTKDAASIKRKKPQRMSEMNPRQQQITILLWETSLRELQNLARQSDNVHIGALIRTAVDEYIARIIVQEGFDDKLRALRRQYELQRQYDDRVFDWLQQIPGPAATPEPATSAPEGSRGKVTRFPGNRQRRNR